MRHAAIALALVTALSACALRRGPATDGRAPLQATLVAKVNRGYLVSVSEPAYVAIFEVVPGVGTSLLYPARYTRDTPLEGTQFAWESPFVPGRWSYQFAGYFGFAPRLEPTYLFMVASREPLELDRIGSSPSALIRLLSYRGFTAFHPYRTMDALATAVIPEQDDSGWSTDVLVVWPPLRSSLRSALAPRLLVRCANGRELYVPIDYPYAGCPGDRITVAAGAQGVDSASHRTTASRSGRRTPDAGSARGEHEPPRPRMPDAPAGWSEGRGAGASTARGVDADRGSTGTRSTGPGFRDTGQPDRDRGNP